MKAPIAKRLIPVANDPQRRVVTSVFPPMRGTEGKSYCRYRIGLPARTIQKTIWGKDTLSTLVSALQSVEADVRDAERTGEVQLNWDAAY